MTLKILLPFEVLADKPNVSRIVAETPDGSFGILPHRRDCVAALAPGILTYEVEGQGVTYVAVDQGVLVKDGDQVLVSVRRAISGTDLGSLHDSVKRQFLTFDTGEQRVRQAVAKIEVGFVDRLEHFTHER